MVLAALAALDGRWLAAAVLLGLAALTRPEGALLAVPLAAIAWRSRPSLDPGERGRALAAVLAAPTALLAFVGYLQWVLGDAGAWGKAEEPWGRSFRLDGVVRAVLHLPQLVGGHPLLPDAALLVVEVGLLALAARRTSLAREWIAMGALVIVLPLFSGTVESAGRFGLLAFPCYWGAGAIALPRTTERAARAACLAALAAGVLTVPFVWP